MSQRERTGNNEINSKSTYFKSVDKERSTIETVSRALAGWLIWLSGITCTKRLQLQFLSEAHT